MLAFAQQKRLAFKEQVTMYADDTKTTRVLGFKARQMLDLAATYDVTDAAGHPIDPRLDRRLVIAMAVALDALQSR